VTVDGIKLRCLRDLFGTEQQRKKKKSSIDNRPWDDFFVPCDDPLDPDADEDRKRQWFEAAKNGNDKLVAQLLNEAPTLLDAVSSGSTALHFATDAGAPQRCGATGGCEALSLSS